MLPNHNPNTQCKDFSVPTHILCNNLPVLAHQVQWLAWHMSSALTYHQFWQCSVQWLTSFDNVQCNDVPILTHVQCNDLPPVMTHVQCTDLLPVLTHVHCNDLPPVLTHVECNDLPVLTMFSAMACQFRHMSCTVMCQFWHTSSETTYQFRHMSGAVTCQFWHTPSAVTYQFNLKSLCLPFLQISINGRITTVVVTHRVQLLSPCISLHHCFILVPVSHAPIYH